MRALLVMCVAFNAIAAGAQSDTYTIDYFTETNGLLSNEVTGLLIDQHGFCRIAHHEGLSRYDGRKFDVFRAPLPFIRHDGYTCISENMSGQIFASNGSTLAVCTEVSARPFKLLARFPEYTFVYSLYADKAGCWLGTQDGLWRYEGGKGLTAMSGINEPVYSVAADGRGIVYAFGETHTFLVKDGIQGKVLNVPTTEGARNSTTIANDGRLWHIAANAKAYAFYDGNICDSISLPADHKSANFTCLHISPYSGRMYYSHGGSWMYTAGDGTWETMPLMADEITGFAEDMAGNLWLSTTNNGLRRIHMPRFGEYNMPVVNRREDEQGSMVTLAQKQPIPGSISGTELYSCLFVTRDSSTWFITATGAYRQAKGGQPKFVGRRCRFICTPEKNCYWYLDTAWQLIRHTGERDYVYPKTIYAPWATVRGIVADAFGHVYVATETALLTWEHERLRWLKNLPVNYVNRDVLYYMQGRLVICSGNVIYALAPSANADPVLLDSVVLSFRGRPIIPGTVAMDYAGNIWAVAPATICILLKGNKGHYSNESKVILNNVGANAPRIVYPAEGHKVCFSARSQTNYMTDVDTFLKRQEEAPFFGPYLTNVQLGHRAIDWKMPGTEAGSSGSKCPSFAHAQNNFTFSFSAISPYYPEYVLYQYRLVGFDLDWQPANPDGNADYTGLPPGSYTLRVRAADARDRWKEATIWSFTILPPWWRTWWAWALWWGGFLAGIIVLFQLRVKAIRRRHKMERLVTEQQLKALRAQINPHFLQNTFDFLGRRVLLDTKANILESLVQVSAYLRSVLYRSDKTVVTLEEEIDFIRGFWAMQQALMHGHFEYIISVDDAVDTFGISLPALLLQPIAENAVKYGVNAREPGAMLTLNVTEDKGYVYCRISDTGLGVAPGVKTEGYRSKGRELTLQRMQLLYRKYRNKPYLKDEQNAGGGLSVTLAIPKV